MKSRDRQSYSAGYGTASLTALMLFGYPPSRFNVNWQEVEDYWRKVREWWLSTQQPGTHEKRSYKFQRYFNA